MITGINPLDRIGISPAGGELDARPTAPVSPAATATSFAEALSAAATQTVGALDRAETLSMQALQGGAETREVVDAVMSAEQSLQAAIAVRDKIVTAYLEISRMSI
ncbi:flagellar hook-basal body complex protein FliE [Mesorhizobium xinjiangense]|uniref:flagellar hook-basal body complex protein FliE n=1 Tax=Mesorhizobium xinjiangense TaxID=2678685 RepID=UPI0012EEDDD5|nr:flagellar hook-basal body complex protein FliE [Mesorhizobium xinjiangense]